MFEVSNYKSPKYHYFTAYDGIKAVGGATVEPNDHMHYAFKEYCKADKDKCAKIVYVQTNASRRGEGIATTILNTIIEMYKDCDIFLQVIPLDKTNTVTTLTSFYEKFGFKRCETAGILPTMVRPAEI
jgi:GNAT superfamily N-acetyltransferase